MPPLEWFDNPYHIPKEGDDDYGDFTKRKAFVIWYCDYLLPVFGGAQNYKEDHRNYRMPVQLITIPGEVKKGAHVSKENEAFGRLAIRNCYEKWSHVLPEKVKDCDWPIPKYDKDNAETHKYHLTKWSDGRNGQIEGAGWEPEAYDVLNATISGIKKFRGEDKANGWVIHKRALDTLKTSKGIALEEKRPSKKRRRGGKTVKEKPTYSAIAHLSDDDFEDDEEEG